MVIRAFPIRYLVTLKTCPTKLIGIFYDELGKTENMTEYTSCTNRVRRVARFDADVVMRSIICNQPNIIVLNHLDYVDNSVHDGTELTTQCKIYFCHGKPNWSDNKLRHRNEYAFGRSGGTIIWLRLSILKHKLML